MLSKLVRTLFLTGILVIGLINYHATPAQAAVNDWQKGGSISPTSTEDFSSSNFQQSLKNLATIHASYVTLIIPYYQSNIWSTDIQRGWNTPSDNSLISAISSAHALGLKVMLKPHLDPNDGQWRANINPGDRDGWFNNYGSMLMHYAQLGQQQGVEQICIGTELIDMTIPSSNGSNTWHWQNLIQQVRAAYNGKLTYSAQGGQPEEKSLIEFWPQLDYIGLSAYFNLTSDGSPNEDAMRRDWDTINNQQILPLYQRFNKPILFTEVGYRSITSAHTAPWDFNKGGSYDQTEQANAYDALFSYWNNYSYISGIHFWEWQSDPNAGGNGNTNYTPQNKLAQTTISNWFAGNGTAVSSPAPSSGTPGFVSTSTISSTQVNQSAQISTTIKNNGSTSNNDLIDLEVYNGSNRVFQQFFDNQNFNSGQSQTYTANWTPTNSGNYTLKVGVFTSGWGTNYLWNDNALGITVSSGNSSPTPTPTPAPPAPATPTPTPAPIPTPAPNSTPPSNLSVNIWWPSNGTPVSGVQPFKAMVPGLSVSDYTMYWQVDGGSLNSMGDSSQDYPHKESLVDISSWTWKGTGPYVLTFIAKDNQGHVLAQSSVNLTKN